MNKPTHLIGGLTSGMLVLSLSPTHSVWQIIGGLSLATIAGIVPDRVQYTVKHFRFPLEAHRGISHTLIFLIVTTLIFRSELAPYWFAGVLSHLLLDVITISGVPLFYPLVRRRVSLSLTVNGGRFEFVLRGLLLVGFALLLYQSISIGR